MAAWSESSPCSSWWPCLPGPVGLHGGGLHDPRGGDRRRPSRAPADRADPHAARQRGHRLGDRVTGHRPRQRPDARCPAADRGPRRRVRRTHAVRDVRVEEGDWLGGSALRELDLTAEGVLVLGIRRANGEFLGAPGPDTTIRPGDTVLLYGRESSLDELGYRPHGPAGDAARAGRHAPRACKGRRAGPRSPGRGGARTIEPLAGPTRPSGRGGPGGRRSRARAWAPARCGRTRRRPGHPGCNRWCAP